MKRVTQKHLFPLCDIIYPENILDIYKKLSIVFPYPDCGAEYEDTCFSILQSVHRVIEDAYMKFFQPRLYKQKDTIVELVNLLLIIYN